MSSNPFMNGAVPSPEQGFVGTPTNEFEVDLTEVLDTFCIPDGAYKVKCVDVEQTVSKGGNPMFVWTFQIADGKYAGFESKVFTAITPAAMWKVAETVKALGVGQQGEVVKFKRSDVVGKECGALFETSEYNGQNRSQITRAISLEELSAENAD